MCVINMISMRSLHLHTLMNHQRLRRHFNLFWKRGAFHIDFFFVLSQSVFLKFLQTFVGNLKKKGQGGSVNLGEYLLLRYCKGK